MAAHLVYFQRDSRLLIKRKKFRGCLNSSKSIRKTSKQSIRICWNNCNEASQTSNQCLLWKILKISNLLFRALSGRFQRRMWVKKFKLTPFWSKANPNQLLRNHLSQWCLGRGRAMKIWRLFWPSLKTPNPKCVYSETLAGLKAKRSWLSWRMTQRKISSKSIYKTSWFSMLWI